MQKQRSHRRNYYAFVFLLLALIIVLIFIYATAHSHYNLKIQQRFVNTNKDNNKTLEEEKDEIQAEMERIQTLEKKLSLIDPKMFPLERVILQKNNDDKNMISNTQGVAHARLPPKIDFSKLSCFLRAATEKKNPEDNNSLFKTLKKLQRQQRNDNNRTPSSSSSSSNKNRFAILTVAVLNQFSMKKMAGYSLLNKIQISQKHDYDLIFLIEDEKDPRTHHRRHGDLLRDPQRPPHWSKLRALRKYLALYEWIWLLDVDTLVTFENTDDNSDNPIETMIDNYLQRYLIEEHRKTMMKQQQSTSKSRRVNRNHNRRDIDIIITHDEFPLNTGSFFIRNSEWSLDFLKRVSMVSRDEGRKLWHFEDQAAFLILIGALNNKDLPSAAQLAGEEDTNGLLDDGQPSSSSHHLTKSQKIDRSHFWIIDNNFFNARPPEFLKETDDDIYTFHDYDVVNRGQPFFVGHSDAKKNEEEEEFRDWVIHFMSAKSYRYSEEWFKWYFWRIQCQIMMNHAEHRKESSSAIMMRDDKTVEAEFEKLLANKDDEYDENGWLFVKDQNRRKTILDSLTYPPL